MKRLLSVVIIAVLGLNLQAAERKVMSEIVIENLMTEVTFVFDGLGSDEFAMAFWLPTEFWSAAFSQDPSVDQQTGSEILDAVSGMSILAVTQASVSPFGSFDFYDVNQIRKGMTIGYSSPDGETVNLTPLKDVGDDVDMILSIFRQIFGAAMGSLGENLQYFVLNDLGQSDNRIVDPYLDGTVSIRLIRNIGGPVNAEIELPLNSLYVPRICPNGKEAHISWDYCPWTGVKLED